MAHRNGVRGKGRLMNTVFRVIRWTIKTPFGAGFAVYLLTMIIGHWIIGPATCRDGWASSAIGRQGACSHHGGINRTPGALLNLVGVGLGIAVGYRIHRRRQTQDKRTDPKTPATGASLLTKTQNYVHCPECGSVMIRPVGSQMWNCSRSPACTGVRN